MEIELLSQLVVAALGITAVAMQAVHWSGVGRLRRILKFDAELVSLLPEGSQARETLSSHIDSRLADLVERETEHRRNYRLIIFGLMGLGAAIGNFAQRALWPSGVITEHPMAIAFFLALGSVVLVLGLPRVRRNSDGLPDWRDIWRRTSA
ncbi:hypothetical protein Rhe02_98930 [Rhizocola hellebori]|uniref:Uncharacterized protein n=1 Tax=Rhizocola hellebori TaxID=1392758 RepID=A0A8J3QML8_9ACTN|nr:hypothetical protein [Rhizocola hellebori]GIH11826.1 hypothetical protein Rhe02_98930 [Rhizocola hellebori]